MNHNIQIKITQITVNNFSSKVHLANNLNNTQSTDITPKYK